jgi:hypothetical protein
MGDVLRKLVERKRESATNVAPKQKKEDGDGSITELVRDCAKWKVK